MEIELLIAYVLLLSTKCPIPIGYIDPLIICIHILYCEDYLKYLLLFISYFFGNSEQSVPTIKH